MSSHRSILDCPPQIWEQLTSCQKMRIEVLLSSTSHPVVVRIEGDDVVAHLAFPGLWLRISDSGQITRTETEAQRLTRKNNTEKAVQ